MGDRASGGATPSVEVPAAAHGLGLVAGPTVERRPGAPRDHLARCAGRAGHCLSMAHTFSLIPCPMHRPAAARGRCLLGAGAAAARACGLAPSLAAGASPAETAGARTDAATAVAYLDALAAAAHAVYFCRRLQHPHGRCWFDPHGSGGDLCGQVLAISHHLRAPAL